MSCVEGTGCECGNECGDGEAECEAPFTLEELREIMPCHGFEPPPAMTLACSRCGNPHFSPCTDPACPQRIIG